jgi:hypothetical protein
MSIQTALKKLLSSCLENMTTEERKQYEQESEKRMDDFLEQQRLNRIYVNSIPIHDPNYKDPNYMPVEGLSRNYDDAMAQLRRRN